MDCSGSKATLRREMELLLSDRPGRGRKPAFTSEQQAAIVVIVCEDPDQTFWSAGADGPVLGGDGVSVEEVIVCLLVGC